MFRLKSEVQFDMAHYLHGYKGKCSNIHGHRYRLVATFAARELHQEGQLRGMVEDFSCIKQALRELETALDLQASGRRQRGRTAAAKGIICL